MPQAARKRRSLPSRSQACRLSSRARARPHRARRGARYDLFRLAADQDQFLTHRQVPRDPEAVGAHRGGMRAATRRAFVSAETAWRMMTRRDPHGNIVRGTIAALGAAAGGADAVAILPFSAAWTSRRLRPPYRPQYADDPDRGSEYPPRRRSAAVRCDRALTDARGRLGPVPGDRAGGRCRRRRLKPGRSSRLSPKVRTARSQHRAPGGFARRRERPRSR